MTPNDTKADSAKGCHVYLEALNGPAWQTMGFKQRAYEWRRLMSQRKAVGRKTYANPYI